jgi:hypothetical protein
MVVLRRQVGAGGDATAGGRRPWDEHDEAAGDGFA